MHDAFRARNLGFFMLRLLLTTSTCFLLVTVIGCGRDEASSPPPPASESAASPTAQVEPDTETANGTMDDDVAPAAPESEKADVGEVTPGTETSEKTEPDEETLALRNTITDIQQLRQDAEFHQAYMRAQEAYKQYYSEMRMKPAFDQLKALRSQLLREQRDVPQLRTAYRDLGSDDPRRRDVAKRILEEADELGSIFLRKAVVEGPLQAALTAAEALSRRRDITTDVVDLIARRTVTAESSELRDELLDIVSTDAEHLSVTSIMELAEYAGRQATAPPVRRRIDDILAEAQADRELSGDDLAKLYTKLLADEDFSHRLLANCLARVYWRRAQLDKEKFNALIPVDEDALKNLRAYADRAQQSRRSEIREWGRTTAAQIGELPRKGLLISITADQEPVRHAESGRVPLDLELTRHVRVMPDGKFGKAYQFDGQDGRVNAVVLGDLNEMDSGGSFTIALWFRRDADLNDRTNHGTHNVLVAQSSDSNNDNLEIGTHGGNIDLYLDTPSEDRTVSVEAGVEDKTWHHLVLAYDHRESPAARLYLDGKRVGADLPWRDPLDNSSGSPFTLGNSFHVSAPFRGMIDQFYLYSRPLTESEIQALYRAVK